MFTGIVQATGEIAEVQPLGNGKRLRIEASSLGLNDVRIGDSIAINGACMTVTQNDATGFFIDVSAESLSKTVGLDTRGAVNLEKAMPLGARVDGHLVSGHVDGVGMVHAFEQRGESWLLVVQTPPELARYFAYKGSIAVNGVSLTVNEVEDVSAGCRVSINLIPHTIAVTTLKFLKPGDRVNLEVDMIARYVERMLSHLQSPPAKS